MEDGQKNIFSDLKFAHVPAAAVGHARSRVLHAIGAESRNGLWTMGNVASNAWQLDDSMKVSPIALTNPSHTPCVGAF